MHNIFSFSIKLNSKYEIYFLFEDVWYFDGLKANLLSISQICDNRLNVLFTKYECEILDGGGD